MAKIHDEVKEVIPGMGEQDKTVFEFKTDRRKFMKTGAALVASLAVPLSAVLARGAAAQVKGNAAASDFKPMTKVNCFSEDGELKEVIFGPWRAFASRPTIRSLTSPVPRSLTC